MSLILKDVLIKQCAESYKSAVGADSIKAGQLPQAIYDAIKNNKLPDGIDIGEFYPGNVNGDFIVNHNLSVIPRFVFGWISSEQSGYICKAFAKINSNVGNENIVFYTNTSNVTESVSSTTSQEDSDTSFCVPKMPAGIGMIPVHSYKYIVIA